MDIRNCRRCGKVYRYDGYRICPKCRQEEEEEFRKVREYIYDNPNSDIQTISEETGVPVKKILNFLKEGRLEVRDENTNLLLACERCGKPIKSGRFCDRCIVEMKRELKSAASKNKDVVVDKQGTMYTAGRHKE